MKISWLNITDRISHELKQLEEEGQDVSLLRDEWKNIRNQYQGKKESEEQADLFYKKIELKSGITGSEKEPLVWEDIVRVTNMPSAGKINYTDDFLKDRILGGWLGRSAGCLLGKPVEKITLPGIIELLSSNNTWPIKDYITGKNIPADLLKKYPWNKHSGKESLKENIVCMNEDDDLNYTMINLLVLEKYGVNFTSEDILQVWMEYLPLLQTFTAERVAYINAAGGVEPPQTALLRNPYREWIGAQIRADLWGWVSPGNPKLAAEFAYRDACISHIRNGMYGEIFFAAAAALSFTQNNFRDIITGALSFVPHQSKFSEAVNFVLALPFNKKSWDEIVECLYREFGKYHWVHTINNAALVCAALISSEGNFEKAVCNVVMGGWDTDSNGATAGSLMGTFLGAKNLPGKWVGPINNRIRSSIKGFDNSLLDNLAERTLNIAKF